MPNHNRIHKSVNKLQQDFLKFINNEYILINSSALLNSNVSQHPLELLFMKREKLVDNLVVGGCLGQSRFEIIVFSSWRSKEGGQQKGFLELLAGRLWPA